MSRQTYYIRYCRYQAEGVDCLRTRSKRANHSPNATHVEVVGKIIYLRVQLPKSFVRIVGNDLDEGYRHDRQIRSVRLDVPVVTDVEKFLRRRDRASAIHPGILPLRRW